MKLILLGAPGAGKGTQANILSQKLGIPTISTGNILRTAVKNETPTGLIAKSYMESGGLVPDNVIMGVVNERLSEPDCLNGYILDGIPRTIDQAKALEDDGVDIDTALLIEISDAEIEARMTGRRTCPVCSTTYHIRSNPPKDSNICDICGSELTIRKDDEPETVKNRLRVYHQQTEPLIEFYKSRSKLKTVDNQPTIEATTEAINKIISIPD
ncbi:Adenylate kinase [Sporobacter termitidis DSM 10068]|uniref:Adenylate kinase n=1 Tax=Sporobacter termitidis DSM 10068 TaxID=1123282 RepID=A0A1M5WKW8_9FIRM|nr:adenylate kinase [Sporobacter termitidis]SHH88141.1 Adenylate kinase [Sporobacter termitidis DSM 10068]